MEEKKETETSSVPLPSKDYEVVVLGNHNVGKSAFLANLHRAMNAD